MSIHEERCSTAKKPSLRENRNSLLFDLGEDILDGTKEPINLQDDPSPPTDFNISASAIIIDSKPMITQLLEQTKTDCKKSSSTWLTASTLPMRTDNSMATPQSNKGINTQDIIKSMKTVKNICKTPLRKTVNSFSPLTNTSSTPVSFSLIKENTKEKFKNFGRRLVIDLSDDNDDDEDIFCVKKSKLNNGNPKSNKRYSHHSYTSPLSIVSKEFCRKSNSANLIPKSPFPGTMLSNKPNDFCSSYANQDAKNKDCVTQECPICFEKIAKYRIGIHASLCDGPADVDLKPMNFDGNDFICNSTVIPEAVGKQKAVVCPICNNQIDSSIAETHVNQCLDSLK